MLYCGQKNGKVTMNTYQPPAQAVGFCPGKPQACARGYHVFFTTLQCLGERQLRTYLDNPMRKRGTEDNGVVPSLTRRVKIGKFSSAARLMILRSSRLYLSLFFRENHVLSKQARAFPR